MTSTPADIALAAERLRQGRVVAFPTETVYGLGADAFNADAVRRVFALKDRPANNPLIVHVADAATAVRCVRDWPAEAQALADAFWPGPLSIVLPKAATIPPVVTAAGPNVAVRCPDHPVALALLAAFGSPLVGPSANRSGGISPTCAAHVRGVWTEDDVFILDGGPCRIGIESTVISLAGPSPRVLRPGMITPHDLARVLGQGVTFDDAPASPHAPDAPLDSPGRLLSHYAPAAPAILVARESLEASLTHGCACLLIHADPPHGVLCLRLPSDPAAYAAALYDALRRADAERPSRIIIERPPAAPDDQRWAAILDRLTRACAPR